MHFHLFTTEFLKYALAHLQQNGIIFALNSESRTISICRERVYHRKSMALLESVTKALKIV